MDENIKRGNDAIGRYYTTPDGVFYSVTTMLGHVTDKSFLDDWRKRVGVNNAKRITKVAGIVGNNYHLLCEEYTTGKTPKELIREPMSSNLFRQALPIMKRCLGDVLFSEVYLYSKLLKLAGTADLVCKWNGKSTLLDFKSCNYIPKHKFENRIINYWIQCVIYSLMIGEMNDVKIEQCVLLFSSKKSNKAEYFSINEYEMTKFVPIVDKYLIRFDKILSKMDNKNG